MGAGGAILEVGVKHSWCAGRWMQTCWSFRLWDMVRQRFIPLGWGMGGWCGIISGRFYILESEETEEGTVGWSAAVSSPRVGVLRCLMPGLCLNARIQVGQSSTAARGIVVCWRAVLIEIPLP
jgi:hypothetical protein